MKQKKGFSLVELLVVIAIIGILSGLIMTSLNKARMKARNSQRVAEFENFSLAMKMYRIDHGSYPPTLDRCCSSGSGGSHNLNFRFGISKFS